MRKVFGTGASAAAMAAIMIAGAARAQEVKPDVPQGAVAAARPGDQTAGQPVDQTASQDSGQVSDIVVTAQRRSESLQKTALAIAVVQPQAILAAGVTSVTQLTNLAPTLQVSNSGPATSVYLRGVGGYASTASQSPAIPYYIDGIYVARTPSVASEFYDVDRLEVLKGPQGTLYGRNASGGAINVLTRNPVLGRVTGNANFELGNYGNQNGEAGINLPLGEDAALRVSGQFADKGGYTSIGRGDDVHQAGRAKLLWKPSENASMLINVSVGHIGGQGPAWGVLNRDVSGFYPWLDASDPRVRAYVLSHTVFGPAAPPGFVRPTQESDGRQDLNFYNISGEFNWTLSKDVTLTVLPSYRHSSQQYAGLFTYLYANGYAFANFPERPETSKATSIEARLSGDSEQLKWVAGGYFFNEDQFQQYNLNAGYIQNLAVTTNFGTRSYAAFGQATYSITNAFRVTGGIRYTSDRRSLSNGSTSVISPQVFLGPPPAAAAACAFPAPTQPSCVIDTYAGKKTYHDVSWKGGIEADVAPDSLFYATVSKGFKAGGQNTQSGLGTPGVAPNFAPETLISYDAGLKNRFFNNRLQLNVAAFYWDYRNHQEPVIQATNAGTYNLIYFNAGKAKIYGGNVEIIARPWTGATISGSAEYAHSRYTEFRYDVPAATFNPANTGCTSGPSPTAGQIRIDCSGFEVAKTPKWVGNLAVNQDIPVGSGVVVANANMTFAASRWLSIEFTQIERAKAYATLDLSLGYRQPDAGWSVTGFVRNVTDATVYTQAIQNPFAAVTIGNINAPRTYGARFGINF